LQDNPEHVEAMLEDCGRQFSAVLAAVYYVNEGRVTGTKNRVRRYAGRL